MRDEDLAVVGEEESESLESTIDYTHHSRTLTPCSTEQFVGEEVVNSDWADLAD